MTKEKAEEILKKVKEILFPEEEMELEYLYHPFEGCKLTKGETVLSLFITEDKTFCYIDKETRSEFLIAEKDDNLSDAELISDVVNLYYISELIPDENIEPFSENDEVTSLIELKNSLKEIYSNRLFGGQCKEKGFVILSYEFFKLCAKKINNRIEVKIQYTDVDQKRMGDLVEFEVDSLSKDCHMKIIKRIISNLP